jgi:purine-binding chemotaxis protein CheW
MSQTTNEVYQGQVIQLVTFVLKGEVYGINVMQVQEVLRVSEIAPVPGAPSCVLGIINLRGNLVTVIDTRARFGMSSKDIDEASRIIVIESDTQIIGMVVDAVAEVVDLHEDQIDLAPHVVNEESSRYIQGVATQGDNMLIVLNMNRLLTDREWTEINTH